MSGTGGLRRQRGAGFMRTQSCGPPIRRDPSRMRSVSRSRNPAITPGHNASRYGTLRAEQFGHKPGLPASRVLYQGYKAHRLDRMRADRDCARQGGRPTVLRGTRLRPQDLLINRDEGIEWLSRNHGVAPETIRALFAFYDTHKAALVPHPS